MIERSIIDKILLFIYIVYEKPSTFLNNEGCDIMLIKIKTRNITGVITPCMEESIKSDFSFLNKYLDDTYTLKITIWKEKHGFKVDAYLALNRGYTDIKCSIIGEDFYQCCTNLKNRIKTEFNKQRKQWIRRFKKGCSEIFSDEESELYQEPIILDRIKSDTLMMLQLKTNRI